MHNDQGEPNIGNGGIALIVRSVLSLGRRLRAARPEGSIALSAVGVLSTLRRSGPMTAGRLAAEEQLQPQSLTRLIAGLEHGGLIARAPGQADRRESVIAITQHGLRVLAADMRARSQWLQCAIAATLNDSERAALLDAAGTMLKLVAYDDSSPGARS